MGMIDRALTAIAPRWAASRAEALVRIEQARTRSASLRGIRAQYDGATASRRTQGWRRTAKDANYELQGAAAVLAQTARAMVRNNPYAERAVSAIATDLVGAGITFQVLRDGKPDPALNALAKRHFETTACDADGRQNLYGLQLLAARTVVESGAVLARNRPRFARDGLPVPFQIQMLEPDHLDATRNGVFSGGTYVSGIQLDQLGARVSYWLFPQHPGAIALRNLVATAVPARDVLHVFRQDRPGQQHGASWFAPVILPMNDFRDYQDAQLLRQKIAASWAVFRIGARDDDADEQDALNDFIEPGLIEDVPAGTQIEFANPPGVDGYADFTKISVRTFATGMNLPYDIFGDLEGVNYSSGRIGRIQYHRQLDSWTWNMLVPQFCEPVAGWFFRAAQLAGHDVEGCTMAWTPPARPMLDLATEGPAIRDMVRAGLMDPETAIRERGEDPDTVLDAWKRWADKVDARQLTFDCDPRRVTQVGNALQPTGAPGAAPNKD
ncbi:lambda family phage portal protein [Sphingomonas endophytica]|uniref:Lambda family phage portal protein n=1 Tax=Sphingomonas endophytica TaxID=869719 RepID=A0A7X0ML31_9SPHN|nr:phage portal protein [Sphingomonas endophytica]MBB6503207.1 lambda family phage portal protein [Sphingomonas endophytica]